MRHGETIWNQKRLLQGSTDINLNESGRELATRTAIQLSDVNFDIIFCSPLKRALETASIMKGDRNISIFTDNRIKELGFGFYEGLNVDDLLNDTACPFHHFFDNPDLYLAPSDGETLEQLISRGKSFMKDIIEPMENTYSRILIVAHGAMNKAILAYVKNLEVKDFWSGGLQANCGISIIQLNNNAYNVTCESTTFY